MFRCAARFPPCIAPFALTIWTDMQRPPLDRPGGPRRIFGSRQRLRRPASRLPCTVRRLERRRPRDHAAGSARRDGAERRGDVVPRPSGGGSRRIRSRRPCRRTGARAPAQDATVAASRRPSRQSPVRVAEGSDVLDTSRLCSVHGLAAAAAADAPHARALLSLRAGRTRPSRIRAPRPCGVWRRQAGVSTSSSIGSLPRALFQGRRRR